MTDYYLASIGYKSKRTRSQTRKELSSMAEESNALRCSKQELKEIATRYNALNGEGRVIQNTSYLAIFSNQKNALDFLGKASGLDNIRKVCMHLLG